MVSPYPQYPQPASYGSGMLAPPPRPEAIKRATILMRTGAALAIVSGIVTGLTTHHADFYAYTSTSGTTVHQTTVLVGAIIGAVIQCLLWLWMAWKTGDGRKWARVVSTVFFGFSCLGQLSAISAAATDKAVLALVISLIEWGVGLAALIYLWRDESSQFFAAAGQAKFLGGYPPQYPGSFNPGSYGGGYQAPGYPPSAPYGQAPYGQPPADSDPPQPPQ
jgi:hypothetical protein